MNYLSDGASSNGKPWVGWPGLEGFAETPGPKI